MPAPDVPSALIEFNISDDPQLLTYFFSYTGPPTPTFAAPLPPKYTFTIAHLRYALRVGALEQAQLLLSQPLVAKSVAAEAAAAMLATPGSFAVTGSDLEPHV